MRLRRFYIQQNGGMKVVGNDLSIVKMLELLNNSQKVRIEITEEDLNKAKEKYLPIILSGNIPEGRVHFVKWLKEPFFEMDLNLGFVLDELSRTLSEIMNACSSTIVFISENNETKMKLFSEERIFTDDENSSAYTEFYDLVYYKQINNGKGLVAFFPEKFVYFDYSGEEVSTFLNNEILKSLKNEIKTIDSLLNLFTSNKEYFVENFQNIEDFEIKNFKYSFRKVCELINNSTIQYNWLKRIFETLWCQQKDTGLSSSELQRMLTFFEHEDEEWTIEIDGSTINFKYDSSSHRITSDANICPNCGSFVLGELWTTPDGAKICPSCAKNRMRELESNRMRGYHSISIFNPQSATGEHPSEKSRYGFELELICNSRKGTSEFYNTWLPKWYDTIAPIIYSEGNLAKLERDGSLGENGEETISQPLNKDFILGDKMKNLLKAYRELYHPESCCGLHVHVDKNALSNEGWGKLIRFFVKNYDKFVEAKIFRPQNHYNDLNYLKRFCSEYDNDEEMFRNICQRSNHYSSISISSHTGKTVEFRCFDSTVDENKFINNIKTIMMLMDNVDKFNSNMELKISA